MKIWTPTPGQIHYAGCLIRDGARCGLARLGECRGGLQAHHVIPKQALKQRFDGWVLENAVMDSRNGMMLCEKHHALNTPDITPEDVPDWPGLQDFAEQYGLEGRMIGRESFWVKGRV